MATKNWENMSSSMRQAVRKALTQIGQEVVNDIRKSIAVRVERRRGPRGGTIIIRSLPGEPPRRETSELWKSVKYKITPKATTIEQLSIYTALPKAIYLEFGTVHIRPRPFWVPAQRRAGDLKAKFTSLVRENLYWANDPFADTSIAQDVSVDIDPLS